MKIRTIVVDDTAIYRRIIAGVVEDIPTAELVGTARDGLDALAVIAKTEPDLVLLDVEMPGMDGLEVLARLRKDHPDIDVVMVSGMNEGAAKATLKALELGALDFIPKPQEDSTEKNRKKLLTELRMVVTLVETRRLGRSAKPASKSKAPVSCPDVSKPLMARSKNLGLVVLTSSTGGPKALEAVIPRLPEDFQTPMLVVQHMPPMFTAALAKDLNKRSKVEVREAQEGDVVTRGLVLIAPGGRHMSVERKGPDLVVKLEDGPVENGVKPAADVLFRSVAANYKSRDVLAVVLTGMGADGCRGVTALKNSTGCVCLVQSPATCVVNGMPAAVSKAGHADEVLDLQFIGNRIASLIRMASLSPV